MRIRFSQAVIAALWIWVGGQSVAIAADVAAGRASATAKCVACHEADDWDGEDAASLQSLISDIVAGKVRHKQKIELSGAEVQNIAAYWGQGKK